MPRQFFTAEDIRRLAHAGSDALMLGQDDILTAEAADVAFALGVKVIRSAEPVSVSRAGAPPAARSLPPLKVVRGAHISLARFLERKISPGTNVWRKEAVGAQDHSLMSAGYMSLDKGAMQCTLSCDEVDVVLEGELVVTRGAEQVRGKPGDIIHIPKGSSVAFETVSFTRFVYVRFSGGLEQDYIESESQRPA